MLLFYWNDKIALNLEQGYTVKVAFLLALSIDKFAETINGFVCIRKTGGQSFL